MTHLDSIRAPKAPLIITSLLGLKGQTGVQTHMRNLLEYAKKNQDECIFVGPDECSAYRLAVRILRKIERTLLSRVSSGFLWYLYRRLDRHIFRHELRKRTASTKAWTIYAQDPVTALAALPLRRLPAHRVVLMVHFNVSQAEELTQRGRIAGGGWVYRRLFQDETDALRQVDGIVVPSKFMLQVVEERCDAGNRALLIPNTCPAPSERKGHIQGDLIAIGTLEPRKNQQFLLHVLKEANLLGHEYTLALAGSGGDREYLETLAIELGIENQVVFLGQVEQAAPLIPSFRLFVHSALVENMPIALIESLAAGVPILAPRTGGIQETFDDGIEGFFWPLDNVSIAATLLISTLEDGPRLQEMSRAAKERYKRCFDYHQTHARLLAFVRDGIDLSLPGEEAPTTAGNHHQQKSTH